MKIPGLTLILLSSLCLSACSTTSTGPSRTESAHLPAPPPDLNLKIGDSDALLVGAGDIAVCGHSASAVTTGELIRYFPNATVFTTGDNAYNNGTAAQFNECYEPAWGSFKDRTRPSPGNHDYGIYRSPPRNSADPYFDYFGANALAANADAKRDGYYSYDLGGWHIVSLNSMAGQTGAPSMKKQVQWLKGDLAKNKKPCLLAYWHHPLYSSGHHGSQKKDPGRAVGPLWEVLYEYGADMILAGHDHHYERFKRLNPKGELDPDKGILQIIVGTGGREIEAIEHKLTTSDKHLDGLNDFGILALALRPNSYEWRFLKIDGSIGDTGSAECH